MNLIITTPLRPKVCVLPETHSLIEQNISMDDATPKSACQWKKAQTLLCTEGYRNICRNLSMWPLFRVQNSKSAIC